MSCSKTAARGAALLALVGAAGLSACAYDPNPARTLHAQELVPTEQYGIKVTSHPQQIALGLHAGGLSATQEAALGQFVSEWRSDGGGAVTLRAPTDGPDPRAARRMQDEAVAYLVKLGVPAERLVVAGYASQRAPGAPLLASYDHFEAIGPNCSGGWGSLGPTNANTPYDHFGCAVTANIAAQVANPRDFLAPAVETPADNGRRQVVMDKYRQGQVTSSSKDTQANGTVSDAAKQ
jgi:pilus assembly protein CpaD